MILDIIMLALAVAACIGAAAYAQGCNWLLETDRPTEKAAQ